MKVTDLKKRGPLQTLAHDLNIQKFDQKELATWSVLLVVMVKISVRKSFGLKSFYILIWILVKRRMFHCRLAFHYWQQHSTRVFEYPRVHYLVCVELRQEFQGSAQSSLLQTAPGIRSETSSSLSGGRSRSTNGWTLEDYRALEIGTIDHQQIHVSNIVDKINQYQVSLIGSLHKYHLGIVIIKSLFFKCS